VRARVAPAHRARGPESQVAHARGSVWPWQSSISQGPGPLTQAQETAGPRSMSSTLAESDALDHFSILEPEPVDLDVPSLKRFQAGPDGVSVVIPAWNEERRLPKTLEQYVRLLESYGGRFEVIVVVDGATDRTAEVAAEYTSREVRVLSFDHKLGKGGAILEGLRTARFDYVGFLDADAPITPVNLAYLLSGLSDADGAIASRWLARSVGGGRQSFSRRIFSRLWNLMTRSILQLDLKDTQCGAKFFHREALKQVLNQVTLTNWAFDASLLFHFKRAGFRIREVPVNWSDHPDSKMRLERAIPAMFLSLVGIRIVSLPGLSHFAGAWAARLHRFLS
jgi:dolichol-phosphate mannosyltransferase